MTVPNDADPLHDGPIDRRLTWKEPTQLVLTQPTSLPQDQATWDSLCVATDLGTGHLHGDVGTAENPRFTYEEAVHNRRSGRSMTLHTGEDVVQLGSDELLNQSGPKLKRLRLAVEEATLPLLPQGVLPGGWDALGRPWALMDCPSDQLPQIPSAHNHSRVTVAVLVSFPPEPLYFPDLAHMDRAIKVWNKASQRKPLGMNDELHTDGRIKGPRRTYERLLLPGYRHSVPVQEAMKEARWPDSVAGSCCCLERSALIQCSATHSVSLTKTSSRGTLASGTLQIFIPISNADSSVDDLVGARPRVEQSAVVPVETHTWEEVEGGVWQSVRGTSDGAMGYALAALDRIRTDVEERFRSQTRALQTGRQEGEEFGRNPQLQDLLGRMRYLWERNIALQLQVHALTEEREELVRRQTTDLETILGLHNQMAELRQERDRLQQQLDNLRVEPPVVATPPASIASEVQRTA